MPMKDEKKLALEIKKVLPARLSVSAVHSRHSGDQASGTLRIYCSADKKAFLSDFEAKLDSAGHVRKLTLDGVDIRSAGFCRDS